MPNRILREGIITSEPVNSLSWAEEVFYRRLHSVVDDFARYFAKPELLRAACYPLKLDKVGNPDIVKWLEATQKAGLIRVYTIDNKEYLQVLNFRQKERAKQSKFPCWSCAGHVPCKCDPPAPVVEVEVEVEDEVDREADKPPPRNRFVKPAITDIREYCNQISATINPVTFFNHYETVGWKVGRNPMKDWKAAVRNWNSREGK